MRNPFVAAALMAAAAPAQEQNRLLSIFRSGISAPGPVSSGKHYPHHSDREIARRRRQIERGILWPSV